MANYPIIKNTRVLVTGGAGFIGSNLCEDLLKYNNEVICLDNFATGRVENISEFLNNPKFKLEVGDIRNLDDCKKAMDGCEIVLQQAALGSVPRSLNDPATTNAVNISGFLNILIAARDLKVKRVVYAASSSTYGDSPDLPKIEHNIGMPLSPYAVTKYVNELYAHVFALNYGLDSIGLRYFNVYGRRQNPNGAYAAVIPKFTMQLMAHESPLINGDGTSSRDFTYIDNVIQMNHLAANWTRGEHKDAIVFNTAVGERNDLNMLVNYLKEYLSEFDSEIANVEINYGPMRLGDIPHSHASIDKAREILGYNPTHNLQAGLKEAVKWYWENLRN
jgi:UDP-N-acetylglucosamine/UDP-N-acetylgalactosamine 4-epimerase